MTLRSRGMWWPTLCVGITLFILTVYILLVASNWIYLGLHDTIYFFSQSRMWERFWLTIWTSTVSTAFSLLIGIPAGYALSRFQFPFRNLVASIIDLPIVVSPAVVGAFLFGFPLIGSAITIRSISEEMCTASCWCSLPLLPPSAPG